MQFPRDQPERLRDKELLSKKLELRVGSLPEKFMVAFVLVIDSLKCTIFGEFGRSSKHDRSLNFSS